MNAARPSLRRSGCRRVAAWLLVLALARPGAGAPPMPDDLPSSEATLARPLVTGRHGMVTALHPLAAMAGMRILLQGGNAFDAAAATAMAIAVVDPKNSTIGGQGFATVYVAREKRVRGLNFFGPSPGLATVEAVAGRDYSHGYLSAIVPSCLAGYAVLHEAYGRLPWRDVVRPALELAEEGFAVTEDFAGVLAVMRPEMDFPTTQAVFFPGGRVPRVGERFRQPDLARTLRTVAEEGAAAFYRGDLARRIGAFYAAHGGLLRYEDLAGYRPQWVEPLSVNYRGYQVYTTPPNSSGVALLLQLNVLRGYDLRALGHNTPDYLNLIAEVQRLGIADRNRYVADPEAIAVPVERLLSEEHAAAHRARIVLGRAFASESAPPAPAEDTRSNTTHLCVADGEGNLVSLTQTLGAWFGSGVVAADTGVVFSNQMRHLHTDPASPSRLGPGRRPRSNQAPVIVLKDGEPVLALGTPGTEGIWQRLVQVLVNLIDFDMDVQRAVSAPRLLHGGPTRLALDPPPLVKLEDRIPAAVADALRARGYGVKLMPDDEGSVNGVARDPATGLLYGGADPRRWGHEEGWWGAANSVYAVGW
ncbi:MAG: gamma-glutamyltransferase [Opitutaceae bacterium]|nr:gamma-glutamyltransferase [Opitutaceae bacterium]